MESHEQEHPPPPGRNNLPENPDSDAPVLSTRNGLSWKMEHQTL